MPRPTCVPALLAGLLAAVSLCAASAHTVTASAPTDPDKLMGRWYEILRMPNKVQRNCHAAYQVWSRKGAAFAVQQVCHRDRADGKVAEITAAARPLDAQNTLFETTFLGGLVHQTYVLADHAPDYSWLISTTADGRFPKLLARSPNLSAAEQEKLKQRLSQLGFDVGRMEPCDDSAG